MNQQETIYLRFTRTAYGQTLPFSKTLTVAEATDALNRLLSDQNRYRLEFQGQRIVSLNNTDFGLSANGESDMGGNIWYSHPIGSSRDMTTFMQGLTVTELLIGESGLAAMYPISLEAWL